MNGIGYSRLIVFDSCLIFVIGNKYNNLLIRFFLLITVTVRLGARVAVGVSATVCVCVSVTLTVYTLQLNVNFIPKFKL